MKFKKTGIFLENTNFSAPSPPSWLPHSQLKPLTTLAPTKIPLSSHFLAFFLIGKSMLKTTKSLYFKESVGAGHKIMYHKFFQYTVY